MKKQLLQIIGLSLFAVLIASVASAYTPPSAAAPAGNTDGPLTVGSANQIKAGGLTVGTFQARENAYFDKNVLFNGLIRGGTPNAAAPVKIGDSAAKTSVALSGTMNIDGYYQSDSLKTGGGKKPLCSDDNGVLYICGGTVPALPSKSKSVNLYAGYVYPSQVSISAYLSKPVISQVRASVSAALASNTNNSSVISMIKNFYTAHAYVPGGQPCTLTTTPTVIGNLLINPGYTAATSTLALPQNCNASDVVLSISSYSPHTTTDNVTIRGN
jgi:hypothetical protein